MISRLNLKHPIWNTQKIFIHSHSQSWTYEQAAKIIARKSQSYKFLDVVLLNISKSAEDILDLLAALTVERRVLLAPKYEPQTSLEVLESCSQVALQKSVAEIAILTSGSSGQPKVVLHEAESLLVHAQRVAHALEFEEQDIWGLDLPLYHVAGLAVLFRVLAVGGTLTLEAEDATHLSWVPTQLHRALENKRTFKHLQALLLGGAPASDALLARAQKRGLPVHSSYGLSELGSTVAIDGILLPGSEIKIGLNSELSLKGPGLFKGYLAPQGLVSGLGVDGFFVTGDLANRNQKGHIEILGRKDSQFFSGGENIQPEEIERALLRCEGVEEATVVPRPHAEFGQRPVAFIRMERAMKIDEPLLRQALVSMLARYKIPDAFFSLPNPGPLGPIKISRKALEREVL